MKNLIRVYAVILLITCAEGTIHVIFSPFLESRAYAVAQIGVLSSLFAVLQLVARLPVGALYSPRHSRAILAGGLALLGATALSFPFAPGTLLLTGLIVLHGFAFGAITTVALALAIHTKPKAYSSGAMMGWYTSAIAAGYALGEPVGGYLADTYGFPAGFGLMAGVSLLALIVVVSLPGLGQGIAEAAPVAEPHRRWQLRFDPRGLPGQVLLATMIVFFVNMMYRSLHTFFPLYALAAGLSLTQLGLLRSLLSLSAAVVRPFSGRLFQRVNYRRVNHAAMVSAAGAVFFSPALIGSVPLLSALYILMGFSRGLTRVTSATMIAESSDTAGHGRSVGLWSGVYNAGLDLGSITGPAIGGLLAAYMGIPRMLVVIAAATLVVYVIVSLFVRRRRLAVVPISALASDQ